MTLRQFVRKYRREIDATARQVCDGQDLTLNDKEREDWVLNDEGLYRWAIGEGVNV